MGLHNLQSADSTDRKRVGRGGKRGKTAGRGMKGQKSRAGGTPRPAYRDVIKKIPKLRGHGVNRSRTINPNKPIVQTITLKSINEAFAANDTVSRATLAAAGLQDRRSSDVKIVATGDIDKKLTFEGLTLTPAAAEKVTKAGGKIA